MDREGRDMRKVWRGVFLAVYITICYAVHDGKHTREWFNGNETSLIYSLTSFSSYYEV